MTLSETGEVSRMVRWNPGDTARFQAVWQRVRTEEKGTQVPAAPEAREMSREERALAGFLRRTSALVIQYRALARDGGEMGALARRLAGEAGARYRRLQMEWFLCRGDVYPAAAPCAVPHSRLERLRGVIRESRQLSADYLAAAELETLRPLCLVFSRAEAGAAEELCRLLERAI